MIPTLESTVYIPVLHDVVEIEILILLELDGLDKNILIAYSIAKRL